MANIRLSEVQLLHTVHYQDKPAGLKFADGALWLASAALGYEDLTLIKEGAEASKESRFVAIKKVENCALRILCAIAAIITLPIALLGLCMKGCLANRQIEECKDRSRGLTQIQSTAQKALSASKEETATSSATKKSSSQTEPNTKTDAASTSSTKGKTKEEKKQPLANTKPSPLEEDLKSKSASDKKVEGASSQATKAQEPQKDSTKEALEKAKAAIDKAAEEAKAKIRRQANDQGALDLVVSIQADNISGILSFEERKDKYVPKIEEMLKKDLSPHTKKGLLEAKKVLEEAVKMKVEFQRKAAEQQKASAKPLIDIYFKNAHKRWIETPKEQRDDVSKIIKFDLDLVLSLKAGDDKLYEDWSSCEKNQGFSAGLSKEAFVDKLKANPLYFGHLLYIFANGKVHETHSEKIKHFRMIEQNATEKGVVLVNRFFESLDGLSKEELQKKFNELMEKDHAAEIFLAKWRRIYPIDLSTDEEILSKLRGNIDSPIFKEFVRIKKTCGIDF